MEAFREIFWEQPLAPLVFYSLGALALAIFIYALVRRVRLWRIGKPEKRHDNIGHRIWDFIVEGIVNALFHKRLLRDFYPGLIHFFLFIGGILLLIGTALDVVNHYVVPFMHGYVYLGVSLAADIGGIMMLVGAILAVIRRYIQKPSRLDTIFDDGYL